MNKTSHFAMIIIASIVVSCGSAAKKADDGWITIFDGTSFDGWRGYCNKDFTTHWTLENDGSMKLTGIKGRIVDRKDLIYHKKLKNFELEFEWRSPPGGNSGLVYYVQELPGKAIYFAAPEYQLCAVDGSGEVSKHGPASLYDMIAADPQNAKVPGEWNKAKIVVNKGIVAHYQNGVKVCEYTLWTPEWKELLNNSKFSEEKWPEAYQYQINVGGDNREGYIGFQDHHTDFWFRNIRLNLIDN